MNKKENKLIELVKKYDDNNIDDDIVSEYNDYSSTFPWNNKA